MSSMQTISSQYFESQIAEPMVYADCFRTYADNHTDTAEMSEGYYIIQDNEKHVLAHADYLKYQVRKFQSMPQSNSLEELSLLEDDWDCEGAKAFNEKLIDKCEKILLEIVRFNPMIFPTARDSIQFEFHKEDGSYLEFEIFINRIDFLFASGDRKTIRTRKRFPQKNILQRVNEFVAE